ncbi:MAG: hypothetical protein IID17_10575 [Nitrospinae bacterium]|nr:hypothetical protein [Nitrospinota bacterium]
MEKCSKLEQGHDQASAESSSLPALEQMNSDLEEIQLFLNEIKKLQDKTEEKRKKSLKPPNC